MADLNPPNVGVAVPVGGAAPEGVVPDQGGPPPRIPGQPPAGFHVFWDDPEIQDAFTNLFTRHFTVDADEVYALAWLLYQHIPDYHNKWQFQANLLQAEFQPQQEPVVNALDN